jgi:hypothetical protein
MSTAENRISAVETEPALQNQLPQPTFNFRWWNQCPPPTIEFWQRQSRNKIAGLQTQLFKIHHSDHFNKPDSFWGIQFCFPLDTFEG